MQEKEIELIGTYSYPCILMMSIKYSLLIMKLFDIIWYSIVFVYITGRKKIITNFNEVKNKTKVQTPDKYVMNVFFELPNFWKPLI